MAATIQPLAAAAALPGLTQVLAIMRLIIALVIGILLSACNSSHDSGINCAALADVPRGKLLLLGEMHGTLESPQVAGMIACQRAKNGPTALGLEIPVAEQTPIDNYLSSDGDLEAQKSLLAGSFWQKSKDGRSSKAVFELIEYARQLKRNGLPLSVFAFDSQIDFPSDRNALIARSIRQYHLSNPSQSIVALMGNAHAGKSSFIAGDTTIFPSGKQLEDLAPISIMLTYAKGSIWACMLDCGVHLVSSSWAFGKPVGFALGAPMAGYEFSYVLPSLTASPPASDNTADG